MDNLRAEVNALTDVIAMLQLIHPEIPQTNIDNLKAAVVRLKSLRREVWKHKKRGTWYEVLGTGHLQMELPVCDETEVVIYKSDKDSSLWVRPVAEFHDGRFEGPICYIYPG